MFGHGDMKVRCEGHRPRDLDDPRVRVGDALKRAPRRLGSARYRRDVPCLGGEVGRQFSGPFRASGAPPPLLALLGVVYRRVPPERVAPRGHGLGLSQKRTPTEGAG